MVEIPPKLRKKPPPVIADEDVTHCIVTGMGEPLMDDFMRAGNYLAKKGEVFDVIGANRSCQLIRTDMNFSLDRDNIRYWKSVSLNQSGPWHSGQPAATKSKKDYPWVYYWWPMVQGAGSSAWGAAKVAFLMGYEEVILCGVPLEQGPYADGIYAPTFQDDMITI